MHLLHKRAILAVNHYFVDNRQHVELFFLCNIDSYNRVRHAVFTLDFMTGWFGALEVVQDGNPVCFFFCCCCLHGQVILN